MRAEVEDGGATRLRRWRSRHIDFGNKSIETEIEKQRK
jgi:hypothetical protein